MLDSLRGEAEVKLASCKYLDGLPTSGNKFGRAFRDVEWEDTCHMDLHGIFLLTLCTWYISVALNLAFQLGGEDPHIVPGLCQAISMTLPLG